MNTPTPLVLIPVPRVETPIVHWVCPYECGEQHDGPEDFVTRIAEFHLAEIHLPKDNEEEINA